MHGIVLGIEMLFFIIACITKSRKIEEKKKTKSVFLCLIALLFIVLFNKSINDYSYLYVNTNLVNEILIKNETTITGNNNKDSNKKETTSNTTKDKNEENYIDLAIVIKDRIAPFLFIVIIIIAFVLYHKSLLKIYCVNLKEELYNLGHIWLNGKTLKNILISIHVWIGDGFKNTDICQYFEGIIEGSQKADIYVILGNPGEGKTISIRKVSDVILDKWFKNYNRNNLFKSIFNYILGKISKVIKVQYTVTNIVPMIFNFTELEGVNEVCDLYKKIESKIINKKSAKNILYKNQNIIKRTQQIISSKIAQGEFIFLIDGYDEINRDTRFKLIKILKEFQITYPKCNIVFSSRTAVFDNSNFSNILEIRKENILHLVPFSKEKIFEFLYAWEFSEGKLYYELYEKIISNTQLELLAENPLLLTLISYLYDNSKLKVPNSIVEFYIESTRCLLDNWESEKENKGYLARRNKITCETKIVFLEEIAYHLYVNKCDYFSGKEAIHSDVGREVILNEIYENSGILEKAEENVVKETKESINDKNERIHYKEIYYKFYHRSFYEFFLACYFTRKKTNINNLFSDGQYFQILFFYFALSNDQAAVEKYMLININNTAVMDSLMCECKIENAELVNKYLKNKKNQTQRNASYYQVLSNLATKYEYVRKDIYDFMMDKLALLLSQKDESEDEEIAYIISAISCFTDVSEVVKLLLDNKDKINLDKLAKNSNLKLDQCIIILFRSNIEMKYKMQFLIGLGNAGKFSVILKILAGINKGNDNKCIFYEFLMLTKKSYFIEWFDQQNLLPYVDEHIKSELKKWKKEFGWKWNNVNDLQQEQRYLLVYYLVNADDEYLLDLNAISNRVKFVASYIKNKLDKNGKISKYYIDIKDYKVISLIEFEYHWGKKRLRDDFKYNPNILKCVPWILAIIFMFIMMFMILKFKVLSQILNNEINRLLYELLRNADWWGHSDVFRIYHEAREGNRYNISISRYLKPNSHMLIFYFSWLYLQIETYKQYINNVYSSIYKLLYFTMALSFAIEYFIVFQDIIFRITGVIIVLTVLTISIFKHKHNLPSFCEPQFSEIRNYLFKDLL